MKCLVSKESVLPYACRWGSQIRKSPIRQVDRGQFFTMTEIPRLAFRVLVLHQLLRYPFTVQLINSSVIKFSCNNYLSNFNSLRK